MEIDGRKKKLFNESDRVESVPSKAMKKVHCLISIVYEFSIRYCAKQGKKWGDFHNI